MKDKGIATILALFLGGLGVHQFYLGNSKRGILYLLFCWTFIPLILSIFDFLSLLFQSNAEFYRRYNDDTLDPYTSTNKDGFSPHISKRLSRAEQIEKLIALRDKGLITDEEFRDEKLKLY